MRTYLPKQDQNLPDSYHVTLYYVTGKSDEFDLASHHLNKETMMLEFWTTDDLCSWVPMSSLLRIEFDKNFSKMVAIKVENELKKGRGEHDTGTEDKADSI